MRAEQAWPLFREMENSQTSSFKWNRSGGFLVFGLNLMLFVSGAIACGRVKLLITVLRILLHDVLVQRKLVVGGIGHGKT